MLRIIVLIPLRRERKPKHSKKKNQDFTGSAPDSLRATYRPGYGTLAVTRYWYRVHVPEYEYCKAVIGGPR